AAVLMPLSEGSKRLLEKAARDWCEVNRADPEQPVAEFNGKPLWAYICHDAINLAGWKNSLDCPDENGPALVVLIRRCGVLPDEFTHG
ncbi:unnamed protein product, partial [marine sediment metagenome]